MVVVDVIARELERVNDGAVITPDFRFRPNKDVPDMIAFRPCFGHLSIIIAPNEPLLSSSSNIKHKSLHHPADTNHHSLPARHPGLRL